MSANPSPPTTPRPASTATAAPPRRRLAGDLKPITRRLQAAGDSAEVSQRICDAAVAELPAAVAAGVTLLDHGRFFTAAATSEILEDLDQMQYRADDGPTVTVVREETTVRSNDLAEEQRWPQHAAAAVKRGLRALLSVQLFDQHKSVGALNIYADRANVWTDDEEDAGLLLAAHAALAITSKARERNLRIALESRDTIGQAKGILMERFKVRPEQAFQLLVAVSQHQHRRLRDIAADLAATGDLLDEPASS
jgi:GAF domain-containing protein